MPNIGDIVHDRYEIRETLGGGAQGTVFRAFDSTLQTDVAIKFQLGLSSENETECEEHRERFVQEALTAARVRHPNVVSILDYGQHDGSFFYVMEYFADGITLGELHRQYRDRGEFIPLEIVHDLFLDAAAGVAALHSAGVIHRDLKLSNFLVYTTTETSTKRYRLKVLDLGIARTSSNLTKTGVFLGTPRYIAPEMYDGGKADVRTDEFALGVAIYEVLTGNPPFEIEPSSDDIATLLAIRKSVRFHHPPQPSHVRSEIPGGWDVLVMTLLEKDRNKRFDNVGQVYAAIQNIHSLGEWVAPENPKPLAGATTVLGAAVAQKIKEIDGGFEDMEVLEDDDLDAPIEEVVEVAADTPGDGDGLATASVEQSAPAEPAQLAVGKGPDVSCGLDSAAGRLASQLVAGKRPGFSTLSVRYRLAIGAAAVALLLLVVIVVVGPDDDGPGEHETARELAIASKELPKEVTASDLIGDERRARRESFLRAQDRKDADGESQTKPRKERESRVVSATPDAGAKQPPSRRKDVPAIQASRSLPVPSTDVQPAPVAAAEPERLPPEELYTVLDFTDGSGEEESTGEQSSDPNAKLGVPPGAEVPARLERSLSSQNPSTPAIAIVLSPFKVPGSGILIPRGSKVFGRATFKDLETSARVQIEFSKIVFPDITERRIRAIATDLKGEAGLPARRVELDRRSSSNVGEAALDVAADLLSDKPGGNLADRFLDDERSDLRKRRHSNVRITVGSRTRLKVFVMEGF